jgi:LytS/YehU family sensor histidine kinase
LFNTLHSVTALMAENVEGARRVLARLGDLLRMSFAYADANEVPVADELLFLDHYLEIQRVRFQNRLIVDIQVDPAAREALVPSLVLQPLVENAIRYAIEPRLRPGTIRVIVSREGPWVRLEVSDDGPGLPSMGAAKGVGIGLANTRERLEKLYGDHHRFELTNGAVAGLTVLIEVPFRGSDARESSGR